MGYDAVVYKNNEVWAIYGDELELTPKIITLSEGFSIAYDGYIAVSVSQSKKLADVKKNSTFKVDFTFRLASLN